MKKNQVLKFIMENEGNYIFWDGELNYEQCEMFSVRENVILEADKLENGKDYYVSLVTEDDFHFPHFVIYTQNCCWVENTDSKTIICSYFAEEKIINDSELIEKYNITYNFSECTGDYKIITPDNLSDGIPIQFEYIIKHDYLTEKSL